MTHLEKRKLQKPRGQPVRKLDSLQSKKTSERKWEKKMKEKARLERIKLLSEKLKNEIKSEQQRAAESRKANRQRKVENEKKNMVVQTIKNDKAMRKLSPKHRRKARIYMLHELNNEFESETSHQ